LQIKDTKTDNGNNSEARKLHVCFITTVASYSARNQSGQVHYNLENTCSGNVFSELGKRSRPASKLVGSSTHVIQTLNALQFRELVLTCVFVGGDS
jgi:hypothetical protein